MKKTTLVIVLTLIANTLFAQVSFGVQLGTNIAFGKTSYDNSALLTVFTNDPKVGLIAGFLAEVPIGKKLTFRPELNFIQKGSKTNSTLSFYDASTKITLNYIEIPLNVVYKLQAGSGNFFFGLGPSFAFGISGKNKHSNSNYPGDPKYNYTADIKFDGNENDSVISKEHLKAFDFGANILAGYRLKMGIFFKIGYTYNFLDIDASKYYGYKNRGLNVCVGYLFGGSKSAKKMIRNFKV